MMIASTRNAIAKKKKKKTEKKTEKNEKHTQNFKWFYTSFIYICGILLGDSRHSWRNDYRCRK